MERDTTCDACVRAVLRQRKQTKGGGGHQPQFSHASLLEADAMSRQMACLHVHICKVKWYTEDRKTELQVLSEYHTKVAVHHACNLQRWYIPAMPPSLPQHAACPGKSAPQND